MVLFLNMSEEESDTEQNNPAGFPSSEVGCGPHLQSQPTMDDTENKWKLLLEQQNQNFLALIQAMKGSLSSEKVHLPTFDPEKTSIDARAWLSTADMCMTDKPLSGAPLILALSKALKGQASAWLSQVSLPGMTWKDFQVAFTARYDISETAASTLINLYNSKPKDGECLATYAASQLNLLMSCWKKLTSEQIAISTVMAHIAQIEPRVNRVVFTTEIDTRTKMQQELKALSYMKRKAPPTSNHDNDHSDSKQRKFMTTTTVKCAHCGKPGHHISVCRLRKDNRSIGPPHGEMNKPTSTPKLAAANITCYNCHSTRHYASRCPRTTNADKKAATPSTSGPVEQRVDVCAVAAPMGTLEHSGESFSFRYDSGAECSLIKESVASKFHGKRVNSLVKMTGIGQTSVQYFPNYGNS